MSSIRLTAGDAEAPRNQWYVIAFGHEIGREPLSRSIMGDPVVLYRRQDGSPVALFDRCPHRGMRLSNGGKVIEDAIQCNYHGLEFEPDGMCSKVPSGGPIPKMMCMRSYPVVEIWDFVWIWPGDPAKADPALIPDHHALGVTDPQYHSYSGLFMEMESNYLHAYENLVEATHISYLHHGFVDNGHVASHPFREIVGPDKITTVREFFDEQVHPFGKQTYSLKSDVVDRELTLIAIPPAVTVVSEKYQEKGIDNPRELIFRLVVPVTPATATSCYQFVTSVRTLPAEPGPLFEGLRGFLIEDQVALRDIQQLFDRLPAEQRVEISVKSDNPALRARRMIEMMIKQERQQLVEAAE